MQKLRKLISEYPHWAEYEIYIEQIEAYYEDNFAISLDSIKSLLEGVCKEICKISNVKYSNSESFISLINKCFVALNIPKTNNYIQISRSLLNIGQNINELRNNMGITSHGRTIDELKQINETFNIIEKELLINSISTFIIFLVQTFEYANIPIIKNKKEIDYHDAKEFNTFLDETYGDFSIGELSYTASQILFEVDPTAYQEEYSTFMQNIEIVKTKDSEDK